MTEDQQPVWVESDGVSNLPPAYAVGVYCMRVPAFRNWRDKRFCFFDGIAFHSYCGTPEEAMKEPGHTNGFEDREVDAWWDYQGLMAKLQAKAVDSFSKTMKQIVDGLVASQISHVLAMESDLPGIAAHAERNKPAPEPEKVVVGGLTIDMADLVEFLKAKQPKPEPNTTPRGILTMWNEGADHRLGMWQQTGNFAD